MQTTFSFFSDGIQKDNVVTIKGFFFWKTDKFIKFKVDIQIVYMHFEYANEALCICFTFERSYIKYKWTVAKKLKVKEYNFPTYLPKKMKKLSE